MPQIFLQECIVYLTLPSSFHMELCIKYRFWPWNTYGMVWNDHGIHMECSIGIPYTIPWIPLTMMNNGFIICHLVATLQPVAWHLEYMWTEGRDRDRQWLTVDGDNIVCHHHQTMGHCCCCWAFLWMIVVVEEESCWLVMVPKLSISVCWHSIWAWPAHSRIKWCLVS